MNPFCMSKHPTRAHGWCDRAPGHDGDHESSIFGDSWSPVRECPDPDDHILARDYAAMSDRATSWQERAERAEQERDEAIRHEREALELGGKVADALNDLNDEIDRATEPHPFTADGITDEMVERAQLRIQRRATRIPAETIRLALVDALTEPPARPEGAEELSSALEAVLAHLGIGASNVSAGERDEAADLLASRGVRVVGEEQS